jgi:hypothetical protein
MPTTIPAARQRAHSAIYANKDRASPIAAPTYSVWHELRKALNSEEFRTVGTFSAIGLLASLVAIISGVQGVWM